MADRDLRNLDRAWREAGDARAAHVYLAALARRGLLRGAHVIAAMNLPVPGFPNSTLTPHRWHYSGFSGVWWQVDSYDGRGTWGLVRSGYAWPAQANARFEEHPLEEFMTWLAPRLIDILHAGEECPEEDGLALYAAARARRAEREREQHERRRAGAQRAAATRHRRRLERRIAELEREIEDLERRGGMWRMQALARRADLGNVRWELDLLELEDMND